MSTTPSFDTSCQDNVTPRPGEDVAETQDMKKERERVRSCKDPLAHQKTSIPHQLHPHIHLSLDSVAASQLTTTTPEQFA